MKVIRRAGSRGRLRRSPSWQKIKYRGRWVEMTRNWATKPQMMHQLPHRIKSNRLIPSLMPASSVNPMRCPMLSASLSPSKISMDFYKIGKITRSCRCRSSWSSAWSTTCPIPGFGTTHTSSGVLIRIIILCPATTRGPCTPGTNTAKCTTYRSTNSIKKS